MEDNKDQIDAAVRGEAVAVPATMLHDEGAIARCFYCSRYSLDPAALSDRAPLCDCGKPHGWSGSFKKPGADALWSGVAPVSARAADAPSEPSEKKAAAWIDEFGNVFPLAYQPSGNPSYLDADKRGWKPLFRAADALDSQPTEPDGCAECRHTYCMSGEVCKACGDVAMQGWKGGRQPTDGGVRNG